MAELVEELELNPLGENIGVLVVLQLTTDRYNKPQDELPWHWLRRAWEAISPAGKQQLTEAISQTLLNAYPQVQAEALRVVGSFSSNI